MFFKQLIVIDQKVDKGQEQFGHFHLLVFFSKHKNDFPKSRDMYKSLPDKIIRF